MLILNGMHRVLIIILDLSYHVVFMSAMQKVLIIISKQGCHVDFEWYAESSHYYYIRLDLPC